MKQKEGNKRTPKNAFEPIGDIEQVRRVRENLKDKPRDLLFFDLVTLSGARANNLLGLKAKDLLGINIGDELIFSSSKKGERLTIIITQKIFHTIQVYLSAVKPFPEDYVFKSRKGNEPLTLSSVSHLVKKWYQSANIKSSPGAKSLHKTWELHYKSKISTLSAPRKLPQLSNNVLRPVQSETLREAVFKELFQAIVYGKIAPGERIIARRIAKQMNVSPMPVRDALGRLEASGFLTFKNKRAYVVNELSQENLREIYNIRLTLECMAAEAACQRCTDKTYHSLKDLHEQFVEAGRKGHVKEIIRLNRDFHKTLLYEANMPILSQMLDNLWVKTSAYFHIILFRGLGSFDGINTAALHKRILDGMITRNTAKLRTALSEDIMSGVNILDRAF